MPGRLAPLIRAAHGSLVSRAKWRALAPRGAFSNLLLDACKCVLRAHRKFCLQGLTEYNRKHLVRSENISYSITVGLPAPMPWRALNGEEDKRWKSRSFTLPISAAPWAPVNFQSCANSAWPPVCAISIWRANSSPSRCTLANWAILLSCARIMPKSSPTFAAKH